MCFKLDDSTWYDSIREDNEPRLCWCGAGYEGHSPEHTKIDVLAREVGIAPQQVEHSDICDGSDGHGEWIGPPQ